jgi:hypothetical protein
MMHHAELSNTLAPEQFGSRKKHRAIDQATNKALTYQCPETNESTRGHLCKQCQILLRSHHAHNSSTCYEKTKYPRDCNCLPI